MALLDAVARLDDAGVLADSGLDPLGDALAGEAHLFVQQARSAVGHVAIGKPDAEDPRAKACVRERLPHG